MASRYKKLRLALQGFQLFLLSVFPFISTVAQDKTIIEVSQYEIALEYFNIAYLSDSKKQLSLSQVIESDDFISASNRLSLNQTIQAAWYKLVLLNTGDIPRTIYLHNKIAYMSKQIDIYEFQGKQQIDQNRYNLTDPQVGEKMMGSSLVYPIQLLPGIQTTLYIRNQGMAHQLLDLALYSKKNSLYSLVNKTFYSNIIISILFTLALYNLFLYIFSRKKEFIYYSLYLINVSVGLFYMYGSVFHHLHWYGENIYWFNLTAILVPFFLMLFIKSIFDIKQSYRKLYYWINFIILLSFVNVLIAFFSGINLALMVSFINFLLTFIVIIILSIHYYQKKNRLIGIFSLAYFSYIVGLAVVLLLFTGLIPYSSLALHASGIGITLEALLFSYLLYYRTRLLEEENEKHKRALILKQKKSQMGDMISAISHQWKQPITAISSIVTLLHYKVRENNPISMIELKAKLNQIDEKIVFLNDILNNFRTFFNPEKSKKDSEIGSIIDKAISLTYEDMLAENISVKTDCNFKQSVRVNQNELLHIILNLLQNSREAFQHQRNATTAEDKVTGDYQQVKIIKIMGKIDDNVIFIDIVDNAGGISESDLPHIFEEFYSLKNNEQGSGLGLYLSRYILEEHMNGSIHAANIKNGTLFSIRIKL